MQEAKSKCLLLDQNVLLLCSLITYFSYIVFFSLIQVAVVEHVDLLKNEKAQSKPGNSIILCITKNNVIVSLWINWRSLSGFKLLHKIIH